MTKVAEGLGLPSGWQDIEVVFFPAAALGIGAEIIDAPTTVETIRWRKVKSLLH